MNFARVLIQECKPGSIEMLVREAEQTLVPRLRGIPGFVSYQIAKVDDRSLVAIGFFATRDGALQLERIGAEWRKQYSKGAIVSTRPYIGEVILDAGHVSRETQPSL